MTSVPKPRGDIVIVFEKAMSLHTELLPNGLVSPAVRAATQGDRAIDSPRHSALHPTRLPNPVPWWA